MVWLLTGLFVAIPLLVERKTHQKAAYWRKLRRVSDPVGTYLGYRGICWEQPQAQTVDLAALIEQLQKSPELASTLAALIAGQKAV